MAPGKEEKIQEAIRALNEGKISSVRKAATFFEVPETTLRNRYKQRRGTRVEGHEDQQHLVKEEERALECWAIKMDDAGFPVCFGDA